MEIRKEDKGKGSLADYIKLRELEFKTEYEFKSIKDSMKELRDAVDSIIKNNTIKVDSINRRLNILTFVVLAQLAGLNLSLFTAMFKSIGL